MRKEKAMVKLEALFSFPDIIRGISGWADIVHLGKNNIQQLILYVRNEEQELTANIERWNGYQKLLKGKTGEDFVKMGRDYENPTDIEIGFQTDKLTGFRNLEPIDAKSKSRAPGSTTFNICGWCKYTGSGSRRYNCMIKSKCPLLFTYCPEVP